ncbi:MAG: helix-turn-helix domain-containing protein [Rhodoblastus sp.]
MQRPNPDRSAGRSRRRLRARAGDRVHDQAAQAAEVEEIAAHVGLSASHFHHLFKRWAGLTPKAFLQAVTIDHARTLLRDSARRARRFYEVGTSQPRPPARSSWRTRR